MHELSVAISIVESVTPILEEDGGGHVKSVLVAVGAHAGVVAEALVYAWGPASAGTGLQGSCLTIEMVPATVWCNACEAEYELPGLRLRCPACDTPTPTLLKGTELDILSLELVS